VFLQLNSELPQFCERLNAASGFEALNLLSTLALAAPSVIGWRLLRGIPTRDLSHLLLVLLAAMLPLSQVVVHGFRPSWTSLADQIPQGLFALTVFVIVFWRKLGLSAPMAALNILGFCFLALMVRRIMPLTPLGDLGTMAPAVLLLVITGGILMGQGRDEERQRSYAVAVQGATAAEKQRCGRLIMVAGLVLAVSLLVRMLEISLCKAVPVGLHWLWQIGAAVVGTLLVVAVMGEKAPARV